MAKAPTTTAPASGTPANPAASPQIASRAKCLRVCQGCSIMMPDRSLKRPGQLIKPAEVASLPNATLEEYKRDKRVTEAWDDEPEMRTGDIPGFDAVKIPLTTPEGTIPQESIISLQTGNPSTPAPTGVPKGLWNLDPSTLGDKTLDQLNAMVKDRDASVPPFETKEEVILFLSQHFA